MRYMIYKDLKDKKKYIYVCQGAGEQSRQWAKSGIFGRGYLFF